MANIVRYDPFGDLFDDIFKGFVVGPVGFEAANRRIKVDVAEQNGEYKVLAELPGVKKEDIQVDIDGAQLTLSAEIKREQEVKDGDRLLHSERSYGKLSRSFVLPQELDEAKAEARFRDGVLELTLPKKAAPARKAITIQ
jgi:HSP20 family protein